MIIIVASNPNELSQTCVRREISALLQSKIPFCLYSLRQERKTLSSCISNSLYSKRNALIAPVHHFRLFITHPNRYRSALLYLLSTFNLDLLQNFRNLVQFFFAIFVANEARQKNAAHIHAHFLNSGSSIALFASFLAKIPFSITVHSEGFMQEHGNCLTVDKLKYAENIFVVSKGIKKEVKQVVPRKNIFVVHCGIDYLSFLQRNKDLKKRLIRKKKYRLLFLGRLVEKKGIIQLMDSFSLVNWAAVDYFTIAGNGPLREELEKFVDKNRFAKVRVIGAVSEKEADQLMQGHNIFVHPSTTDKRGEKEGIPVSIMEALSHGLYVVSTKHSGIPELIQDGVTGTLVCENDSNALAAALNSTMTLGYVRDPFILRKTLKRFDFLSETLKKI